MCELPEFFHDGFRTARKEHVCCECPTLVKPGEKYWFINGKWSGEMETFKRCLRCHSLSIAMANENFEDDCGGHPFGMLYDHVREFWKDHGFPLEHLSGSDLIDWADDAIEIMENRRSFTSMGLLVDYHEGLRDKWAGYSKLPSPEELCVQSGIIERDWNRKSEDGLTSPTGYWYLKGSRVGQAVSREALGWKPLSHTA